MPKILHLLGVGGEGDVEPTKVVQLLYLGEGAAVKGYMVIKLFLWVGYRLIMPSCKKVIYGWRGGIDVG